MLRHGQSRWWCEWKPINNRRYPRLRWREYHPDGNVTKSTPIYVKGAALTAEEYDDFKRRTKQRPTKTQATRRIDLQLEIAAAIRNGDDQQHHAIHWA